MIEYSDLEFFERVGEGLTATVWRGRWKSEDMVVAVKKMEEMTNREVENVHCLKFVTVQLLTVYDLVNVWLYYLTEFVIFMASDHLLL